MQLDDLADLDESGQGFSCMSKYDKLVKISPLPI